MFSNCYSGKKVLVTGHTGFKGAWLCECLHLLGAETFGYSLNPPTTPALFDQIGTHNRLCKDIRGDIRDLANFNNTLRQIKPDFLFHLAAQALVKDSYDNPIETISTNVMGTANVLEALRNLNSPCIGIIVTTDKCYANNEWIYSYRENDPLGGYDPYSAGKACAELLIASYRNSFFRPHSSVPIAVASVRAGNVIGGGDWANYRIVPDCVRSLQSHQAIPVRNKHATRPWQHVLDPLSGYLLLGNKIQEIIENPGACAQDINDVCTAFNFGPELTSNRTVKELITEIISHWPGDWYDASDRSAPHEAGKLNLAIDRAFHVLGWQPVWNFERAVKETMTWYRLASANDDPLYLYEITVDQIKSFQQDHMSRLNSNE